MMEIKRRDFVMWKAKRCLGVIIASLLLFGSVLAQQVRFQNFSEDEGLKDSYVNNIVQDKNGFIWLGTGQGLCRYDGHEFISPAVDALPTEVVYVSFVDNLGKLWFGFSNGAVWSYDGVNFASHVLDAEQNLTIIGITQSKELGVIIATQNKGLYRFNAEGKPVKMEPSFEGQQISTIHVSENNMLVGDMEGLFISRLGSGTEDIQRIDALSYIQIISIKDAYRGNSFWIGTYDEGLYFLEILEDSVAVQKISNGDEMDYLRVSDITFNADSNLMVCAANAGVFQLNFEPGKQAKVVSVRNFKEENGLSTNNIECLYLDHEKNMWFGTNGKGLSLQTNQFFGFFDLQEAGAGNSVHAIAEDDIYLWVGCDQGIVQINKLSGEKILVEKGIPKDIITSLYSQDGIMWVGTATNGIYKYENGKFSTYFRESNSISNSINHITGDDRNLYVATKNGVFFIDKLSGEVDTSFTTMSGLPHNDIEYLYLDSENRLLLATRTDGIYELDVQRIQRVFTVGEFEIEFTSIVEDEQGNIWVSTYGQGLFLHPSRSDSIINIRDTDGLRSNYCYSLMSDHSGFIWVGHRGGLSKININSRKITMYDSDNGITGDCNQNATYLSRENKLYFGTSDGLSFYDLEGSLVSKTAPLMNVLRVFISDKKYDFNTPIHLPYKAYKLRIDFVGLQYSDPESVRYQYKLEGHDLGWSDITGERSVTYPRLEDGEYTFLVKAITPDGRTSQISSQVKIEVKPPIWKQWWFITLLIIILILAIIVIIKYRERKQKQIQEYLEQRLDERTREVVEQKEEIEIKNRDITDSINYAQRIQSSILPPIKRLQQYFDGSFVFYQPRDIVSGDFYWFDKIRENKFVIVCADSTGHGVPGAFMSMIGTTLIKDICMREDVDSPSRILTELDIELRNMLNQNVDAEQSNDGMDIIVCEVDIRTNYLRYSSAMRPMIVYRGGEQVYLKGSRSSVGGQYDKDEKIFKDEGMQLNKGDLIYMFSDGYPDQFGGSVGKKFKMVRLKNLLKDIHQKPMEEQYEYVRSTFNLWKEDFEQVDDVLFMGVKI